MQFKKVDTSSWNMTTPTDAITLLWNGERGRPVVGKRVTHAEGAYSKAQVPDQGQTLAERRSVASLAEFLEVLKLETTLIPGSLPIKARDVNIISEAELRSKLGFLDVNGIWEDDAGALWAARLKANFIPSTWRCIDQDVKNAYPSRWAVHNAEEMRELMVRVHPAFGKISMINLGSGSSRVLNKDGMRVLGDKISSHTWFQTTASGSVSLWPKLLLQHARAVGMCYDEPMKMKDGSTRKVPLNRPPWDVAVLPGVNTLIYESAFDASEYPELHNAAPAITVVEGEKDCERLNPGAIGTLTQEQEEGVQRHYPGTRTTDGYDDIFDMLTLETVFDLKDPVDIDGKMVWKITLAQYWASAHGKLRCQAPFRVSSSFAAFLGRDSEGSPFCYDSGSGMYRVLEDEAAKMFGLVPAAGLPELIAQIGSSRGRVVINKAVERLQELEPDLTATQARKVITDELAVNERRARVKNDFLHEFFRDMVYVYQGKPAFYDVNTGATVQHQGVAAVIGHVMPPKESSTQQITAWLNRLKEQLFEKVTALIWDPRKPPGSVPISSTSKEYNTYRPANLMQGIVEMDEIGPWLEHLQWMLPDVWHDILCWMARVVQDPGLKPNFHPLFISKQGVGKGLLFKGLEAGVGEHNVKSVDSMKVEEKYQDYMKEGRVIRVQEIMSFDQAELANMLKDKMTDQDEHTWIRRFNNTMMSIANVSAWWFESNEEAPVRVEKGDRRFWVHKIEVLPNEEPGYYKRLAEWLQRGGADRVGKFLYDYKAAQRFDVKCVAPMTYAKSCLMEVSKNEIEGLLDTLFNHPDECTDVVGGTFAGRTIVSMAEVMDRVLQSRKRAGARAVSSGLSAIGWRRVSLEDMRLWSNLDLKGVPAQAVREMYQKERGRGGAGAH